MDVNALESRALLAPEWFRIMADAAPVMIWMSGTDKLSTYFNQPWLEFTGRTLDQELGIGWSELLHPDDFQRCLTTYTEAFDARRGFEMECRARRDDGLYRWLLNRGNPMHTADGAFLGYIGSSIDISDHKAAQAQRDWLLVESLSRNEEELRFRTAELARVCEEQREIIDRLQRLRSQRDAEHGQLLLECERRRIAHDLHEYVEQTLFAIGLAAQATLNDPPADRLGEVAETLARVGELAADGVARLREASFALYHADVVGRGLVPMLSNLATDFRQRTGIEADIVLTGSQRRFPTKVAEALYATAHEALANVERHSDAGAVILGLHIRGQSVTLSIQDDGTGASVLPPDRSAACFGLGAVRARVRDLNGRFVAGPNPDGGFRVRTQLSLPMATGAGIGQH